VTIQRRSGGEVRLGIGQYQPKMDWCGMKCLRRTKEFSAQVIGNKINDVGLSCSGVLGEADLPNQKTNGGEGVGEGLSGNWVLASD